MGILYNPKLYRLFVDPMLSKLRARINDFAGIEEGNSVLDVCCGTGEQAIYFARQGALVTGIDLDEGMIDIAKKRKENGYNLNFRVADASNMSFENNMFDYSTICLGLHELNETLRHKIISEMRRVTKKGGCLVLTDYNAFMPKNLMSYMIKIMEYVAGRQNYGDFKEYVAKGGLDALLKDCKIADRLQLKNGSLALIKVVN